jgi:hypothetical protein
MKKIALLLVSILCIGVLSAGAQGFIVKAGYNYSASSVSEMKKGRSGWQAGIGFQTSSSHGFSFQPELLYKVSGLKLSDGANLSLGYLELPLNVQWGPDLLICRPFVFAGPYVGYKVRTAASSDFPESAASVLNKFEFGLGAGLGINIWKLQIAGRFNWNLGSFADVKSAQQVIQQYEELKGKARMFEISVGLRF